MLELEYVVAEADIVKPSDRGVTVCGDIIMIQQVGGANLHERMKGQFIADLCVDGAKGVDISLPEIAFCKVFILPAVLGVEAEFFTGAEA